VVTLTGRYVLNVVALPPAGTGDLEPVGKRTANLLYLSSPLCIESDDLSEGLPAATDVQVLCPNLSTADRIEITGRLFGAHTGNGHTPVLLICPSPTTPRP
jgi:hypothetical protein